MAYFALVVSNTALAKSAGSSWWSQGFTYLWNFVSPYTLWLPFILIIPVMAPRVRRWWVVRDRSGVVVLLTPLAAGLVDALYVTSIGGDYMHARLLLPAFFSLCIGLYVEAGQMRTLAAVPVIGILIWSVACAGWLRFDIDHAQLHLVHGISNERDHWVAGTGNPHPVTIADWSRWTVTAEAYHQAAQNAEVKGRQKMFITTNPYFFTVGEFKGTAKTKLPVHLVVNIIQIGSFGLVSGPDVYVFDAQSLANPIGSHFTGQSRGLRPGGKVVPSVWMIARFGTPGERFPASIATPREIAAARTALACPALSSYLHAITAPLSVSRAFSDFTHSLQYTTMSFSSRPVAAEQQLCG
jgi:arabinofuranosyltransferase